MKNIKTYITAAIATAILTSLMLYCVPAYAAHTGEIQEVTYYGKPGDVIQGQVAIENTADVTKTVVVHLDESDHQWVEVPQTKYVVGPKSKTVIRYVINIADDTHIECESTLHIQEVAPTTSLSLIYKIKTIVIPVQGAMLLAAPEANQLYTLSSLIAIIAFSIGITLGGLWCIKRISKR